MPPPPNIHKPLPRPPCTNATNNIHTSPPPPTFFASLSSLAVGITCWACQLPAHAASVPCAQPSQHIVDTSHSTTHTHAHGHTCTSKGCGGAGYAASARRRVLNQDRMVDNSCTHRRILVAARPLYSKTHHGPGAPPCNHQALSRSAGVMIPPTSDVSQPAPSHVTTCATSDPPHVT